jgi:hypothetical protein
MKLMVMVGTSGLQPRRRPVTEQQLARMAKRRLAILRHAEEITGNVGVSGERYSERGLPTRELLV